MTVDLISVTSGRVLDTITGEPGDLHYATGRARDIVATLARHADPSTLADILGDWSNGYVQLRRRTE